LILLQKRAKALPEARDRGHIPVHTSREQRQDLEERMAERAISGARQVAILDLVPPTQGWLPIKHLVSLLQHHLDADLIPAPQRRPALVNRLRFRHTSFRARGSDRTARSHLLVVAPRLENLARISALPHWRRRFGRISAWLIDSFWTDALSRPSGLGNIDHLFITWGGDLEAYRAEARGTVDWLPWGTDALGLGLAGGPRPIDVLRLGRQPAIWDDDAASAARLAAVGLHFAGRPGGDDAPTAYASLLGQHLAQTKSVLTQSNLVGEAAYTHPDKEYMTARWTDAFACGCIVAGAQPKGDPLFARVTADAVLDFDPQAGDGGLSALSEALQGWTPERTRAIHHMALREFDWRWRIRDLVRRLELPTSRIDAEIAEIERRIGMPTPP
jgi:hypothetical protein